MRKLIRGTNKNDTLEYVYLVSDLRRSLFRLALGYFSLVLLRLILVFIFEDAFIYSLWSIFLAGMTGIVMGIAIHAVVIYKASFSMRHIESLRKTGTIEQ